MAELQKDPMTRGDFLGFGVMGAIVGAVLTIPPVAFILDPMHANYDVMLGNALEVDYGYPSVPGALAIRIGSDLRTGGQVTSIDPVKTITQVGDRPVLLLHSTTDKIDPPTVAAEKNLPFGRRLRAPLGGALLAGAVVIVVGHLG